MYQNSHKSHSYGFQDVNDDLLTKIMDVDKDVESHVFFFFFLQEMWDKTMHWLYNWMFSTMSQDLHIFVKKKKNDDFIAKCMCKTHWITWFWNKLKGEMIDWLCNWIASIDFITG